MKALDYEWFTAYLKISIINCTKEQDTERLYSMEELEELKVRFTFDDDLMKRNGIERQDVYYTLKSGFQKGDWSVFQTMMC